METRIGEDGKVDCHPSLAVTLFNVCNSCWVDLQSDVQTPPAHGHAHPLVVARGCISFSTSPIPGSCPVFLGLSCFILPVHAGHSCI